jgi:hypothetical protein
MILLNFVQEDFLEWLLGEQKPHFVRAMCTASLDMVKLLIEIECSAANTLIGAEDSTLYDSTVDHDTKFDHLSSMHGKTFSPN